MTGNKETRKNKEPWVRSIWEIAAILAILLSLAIAGYVLSGH